MWLLNTVRGYSAGVGLAFVGCMVSACDSTGELGELDVASLEHEAIEIIEVEVVEYEYSQPAITTLGFASDGRTLEVSGQHDGFRGDVLSSAEITADVVEMRHEPGNRLVLLVNFTNIATEQDYDHIQFTQSDKTSPGVSATLPVLSSTTSWDVGETSGAYRFVVDHQGGKFQFFVDIMAEQVDPDANDGVHEFSVHDEFGTDDIHTNELYEFLASVPEPAQSDWILFEITSPDVHRQGAWCSTRADWYIQRYLAHASGAHSEISGAWEKYVRNHDASPWEYAINRNLANKWGGHCSNNFSAGAWCAEWFVGNGEIEALAFVPTRDHKSEIWNWGNFVDGGTATIRVGPSRLATCGF